MLSAAVSDGSPRTDGGESRLPFVSVVMPVYNDPDGLRTTLDSLVALDYPTDRYEVLVVDNDSTDETPQVAESFAADHENVFTFVEREVQSSYAARNTGIESANGEVFAFIDADMHVEADWLDRVVAELDASGADYMGCSVELYTPGEETLAAKFDSLRGFDIDRYVTELNFAPTCCLVVRRPVFESVGRFDERLVSSGDLEFGNRVADAGFDIHHAKDIVMYHPTRGSLESNVKKGVRIGRGRYQLSKYYPERYGSKYRRLFNPIGYVPPIPWQMPQTFRDWETLSVREKVGIYLIVTLISFARDYGRVSEALGTTSTSRPPNRDVELSDPADSTDRVDTTDRSEPTQ